MSQPTLYFNREEFAQRQARVRTALSEKGLEGMLLFKIEDMHWLCGLDAQGFVVFHAMYIGVNGEQSIVLGDGVQVVAHVPHELIVN